MGGIFKIAGMGYQEIVERYGTDIKQVAYSYVKDRHLAEDITQEAFLRCLTKGNTFKGKAALKTWLYRIAINLCKDHLKTAYHNQVIINDNLTQLENNQSASAEVVTLANYENDNVTDYILTLPIQYREVIILF